MAQPNTHTLTAADRKRLSAVSARNAKALSQVPALLRNTKPVPPVDLRQCRDNPMQRRQQKYSNERIVDPDGLKFDSKAEHKRWHHLVLMQRAGRIKKLERQVVYELAPGVTIAGRRRPPLRYIADMRYMDVDTGQVVVEDVKGAVTAEYRIKRHLMASVHGIEIREIRA